MGVDCGYSHGDTPVNGPLPESHTMNLTPRTSFYVAVFDGDTYTRANGDGATARSWPTEEQAIRDLDNWALIFRTDMGLSLGVVKETATPVESTIITAADLRAKNN